MTNFETIATIENDEATTFILTGIQKDGLSCVIGMFETEDAAMEEAKTLSNKFTGMSVQEVSLELS